MFDWVFLGLPAEGSLLCTVPAPRSVVRHRIPPRLHPAGRHRGVEAAEGPACFERPLGNKNQLLSGLPTGLMEPAVRYSDLPRTAWLLGPPLARELGFRFEKPYPRFSLIFPALVRLLEYQFLPST